MQSVRLFCHVFLTREGWRGGTNSTVDMKGITSLAISVLSQEHASPARRWKTRSSAKRARTCEQSTFEQLALGLATKYALGGHAVAWRGRCGPLIAPGRRSSSCALEESGRAGEQRVGEWGRASGGKERVDRVVIDWRSSGALLSPRLARRVDLWSPHCVCRGR